jgi:hypothetical protein
VFVEYRRDKRNQIRELLSCVDKKEDKMSSSEQKTTAAEQPHVSYYWNDVLEWERQAKAEKEAKLAQQREEEEKERTKSAAAKDLLEALQEEQILNEIEIKQEIVLDPNE